MRHTYENLKHLSKLHHGPIDLESCSIDYRTTESPIILSYAFVKLYALTVTVSRRYYNVTEDDVSSHAVEQLHKSLLTYDNSKGAQFATYYVKNLSYQLRAIQSMTKNQIRSLNFTASSLTQLIQTEDESTEAEQPIAHYEKGFNRIEILDFIQTSSMLTDNEKKYCILIVDERFNTDTEIAKELGITSAAVTYIKQSLQKKLAPIFRIKLCTT